MARRLPPLNGLRAFEAAARHLSLTKAAEELHVTPGAISQQVKALEQYLGVRLFRRMNRALLLTDVGQACLPGLREGFDRLAAAVESARRSDSQRPLTVSVAPSFAAKWLVPRLDHLRRAYPGIDVRVDASLRLSDFDREDVDVGIRYGGGDYPGLRVDRLLTEEIFPVCSPALLRGPHPLRQPADLRFHTLLHVDWAAHFESWPDWRMWLTTAGIYDIDAVRGPRFTQTGIALQAAIEGQGVALAGSVLVAHDLQTGRLIKPFAQSMPTSFAYFLVCSPSAADLPRVATFRRWILAEAESYLLAQQGARHQAKLAST